jgi:FtsH-binding integral membrane protein
VGRINPSHWNVLKKLGRRRMVMQKTRKMKIVALLPSGFVAAILLLFMVGETLGGDWSGLGHLIQLIPVVLLMWLGWKRPLLGGIFLFLLSLLAANSFANPFRESEWLAPFLIIVAPLLLSGVLFLGVTVLERKTTQWGG